MESRILDHWDAVHARAHRWRWWIRLGLAIVLLLWFWRFGHSRMYTPPVDVNALAMRGVPSPSDPDAGLAAAISRIPPLPPLPAPPEPPAGQQWSPTAAANDWTLPRASINLQEALNGSWTPQTRYHLQAVIAYIESPQMQAALADAAEQVRTVVLPPGYINANLPWSVRQLAILLVVRARCHMAGRQDVVAASQDLACVLDICRMLENDGVDLQHLISIDCRNLVWDEVQHWCREFPLVIG